MDRETDVPAPARAGARWLRRCAVVGLIFGFTPAAMASYRIAGQIVYGTVNNDLGEPVTPTNLIQANRPIQFVQVKFVEQTLNGFVPVGSPDITDKNGRFSIVVPGTPRLWLVTTAKNDYAEVWKHHVVLDPIPPSGPLEVYRDISGFVDYSNCPNDVCQIADPVTAVSDVQDIFWTYGLLSNTIFKNYFSRAFYVATAAHASGDYIESEEVYDGSIPALPVMVKMGVGGSTPAYYNQLTSTIYLQSTQAASIWHEFGHFLQDRIGEFALVPPYLGPSHNQCTMMTDAGTGNQNPNLCWSYLEGLADWFGALNASALYGDYATMVPKFRFDDNIPCTTDGDLDVDREQCGPFDTGDADGDGDCSEITSNSPFSERRAVESIVANVLWDLLDDAQDLPNPTGIDEVGTATPAEILGVITNPMNGHTSCGFAEINTHAMGLDEFWDQWRILHPDRMADIFAAYAYNGADVGNAADVGAPFPVSLSSESHTPGVWSRDHTVELKIEDGADDVSGSYSYFVEADQQPLTAVATTGTATFKDKAMVQYYDVTLPDGDDQFIHVNSLDMKGHQGTGTAHFGRLRIDTVDPFLTPPYFTAIPRRIDPTATSDDPTLMLGYPVRITWATDDAMSGVAEVRLTFADVNGFSKTIHTTPNKAGTFDWMVTDVPATSSGQLLITVTDFAGNDLVESIPAPVTTPFLGPIAVSLGVDADPCEGGRVISADLHNDDYDDVVLVCGFNNTGHLYVFRGTSNGLTRVQDFPWRAADDLAAADLDRDGDLDVVTVNKAAPGANTIAEILLNDGTGTLVDSGKDLSLGALDRKTVRVIHPYDRRTPVLAVFGALQPGNVPAIAAFNVPTNPTGNYPVVSLPGVDPVDGDWEAGDMNGDGYVDLVSLGVDAAFKEALTVFYGGATAFTRQDVETYTSVTGPDVDLGDFDADGRPDIFVMFEDTGLALVTKLLRRTAATFMTFDSAGSVARRVSGGDGFIVDTANDAQSEVVAMGLNEDGDVSGWYRRADNIVGILQDTTVAAMKPLAETDTAWGDFDKDGDLDVFQVGSDVTGFQYARYENQLGTYIDQNDKPKQPINLSSVYDPVRGGYTFSWSAPANGNDETLVQGFGYELRVGTTQNGGQVLSWAHPAGASQQGFRLDRFVTMPPGAYWFSVRTVDSGWMRSAQAAPKQTTP